MFKLDLEKAEEPEINCHPLDHWKKKIQKNVYFCFIDNTKAFDCAKHHKLWEILKEMGIPDHITCLLRNLFAHQEATVRTGHRTTDWIQIREGVWQGCILSPCLFKLCRVHHVKFQGWMKHMLESRLPEEISIISGRQMTLLLCRKQRRTKEPLDGSERGEWKIWLKTQYSEN